MPLDFSNQDLQRHSFQGKNLKGANFQFADVRSANFGDAMLTGANFSNAIAGISDRSSILLLLVAFLFAALTGFFSIQVGAMEIVAMAQGELTSISASIVIFVALPLVTLATVRRGLSFSIQNVLIAFSAAIVLPLFLTWLGMLGGIPNGAVTGIVPGLVAVGLLLAGAGVFAIAIAIAGLVAMGWAFAVTGVGLLFILASIAGGLGMIGTLLSGFSQISASELARSGLTTNPEVAPIVYGAVEAV
jgi:Pentapeptide repeats (8 copies)